MNEDMVNLVLEGLESQQALRNSQQLLINQMTNDDHLLRLFSESDRGNPHPALLFFPSSNIMWNRCFVYVSERYLCNITRWFAKIVVAVIGVLSIPF
jgi:hypothetical protein